MKKIIPLLLLLPLLAFGQGNPTNVQKTSGTNQLANGSIVVGNGISITATGTGQIVATSVAPGADVTSITGTTGNVLANGSATVPKTGAVVLSLPTALTAIDSITAEAGTNMVLTGGSSGDSLTLSQNGGGVNFNIPTSPGAYNFVSNPIDDLTLPVFSIASGASNGLGVLTTLIEAHPSATGANRFVAWSVRDLTLPRSMVLQRTGGDVLVGTTTDLGTGGGTITASGFRMVANSTATNLDSLASTAGTALTLKTGTFGTGLTLASSTGIPSFAALTGNGPAYTSGSNGTLNIGSTTGTGTVYALASSPTFITPTLGAALATSINSLTLSSSTGTFTLANAKTLTASNTLTFTGNDGSSVNFGAGGTVLYSGGSYVSSIAGTAGQITASASTGAVTLSLPQTTTYTANSTQSNLDSITATASTNLTLAAGSGNKSVVINPTGTGQFTVGSLGLSNTYNTLLYGSSATNFVGVGADATAGLIQAYTAASSAITLRLNPQGGNVLVGGTTDITGSGGIKTFGASAPTNTTSGSNQFTAGIATNGPTYGTTANYSGAVTSTAAGGFVASGNYTSTPSAATGVYAGSIVNGALIIGSGTTYDVSLFNKAGAVSLGVLTGTVNLSAAGTLGVAGLITATGGVTFGAVSNFGTNLKHTIAGHLFVQGDANTTYLYGGTSGGIVFRNAADSVSNITVGDTGITTFASTTSGTSTTAAAILGKSMGLTENLWVGGTGNFAANVTATYSGSPKFTATSTDTFAGTVSIGVLGGTNDAAIITNYGTGNGFLRFRVGSASLDAVTIDNSKNMVVGGTVTNAGETITAGHTLTVTGGTNALSGTVTLVAGLATITSTAIDTNTVIVFSEVTSGGTPGLSQPLAKCAAGSAAVTSVTTDTSTYNWCAMKRS